MVPGTEALIIGLLPPIQWSVMWPLTEKQQEIDLNKLKKISHDCEITFQTLTNKKDRVAQSFGREQFEDVCCLMSNFNSLFSL